ncbi:conserved hypothetical protein [Pseudomonas sp. IT-194MI4]
MHLSEEIISEYSCFRDKRNLFDFNGAECESRFSLKLLFYWLSLKLVKIEKSNIGLFFMVAKFHHC